jgi:hypothetical protein
MASRSGVRDLSRLTQILIVIMSLIGLIGSGLTESRPAAAIPLFARRYGVTCQTCHSIVPRLNSFGEAFMAAGFRWPAPVEIRRTFPVAAKVNLSYTSRPQDGLPATSLDELEFLSFGPLGTHLAYRIEQYAVDGGLPGKTRDAFVEYVSDPLAAWHGSSRPQLDVQAGQFTLPLPNDPETQRPTENHYAIFDQTVGANPFDFFDDRIGVNLGLGVPAAGVNLLALKGHDPQSGLPTRGTDTMAVARVGIPLLSLFSYAYHGTRPLGIVPDAFTRRGFALKSIWGRARTSLLLQTGDDTSADGLGTPAHSSGGYLQEEWEFDSRLIGALRYDSAIQAGALVRSTTLALTYRPYARAHLRLEDVYSAQPRRTHTINAAWLFAY